MKCLVNLNQIGNMAVTTKPCREPFNQTVYSERGLYEHLSSHKIFCIFRENTVKMMYSRYIQREENCAKWIMKPVIFPQGWIGKPECERAISRMNVSKLHPELQSTAALCRLPFGRNTRPAVITYIWHNLSFCWLNQSVFELNQFFRFNELFQWTNVKER